MALSWLLGIPKSDAIDPTTGLSERDSAKIADTWALFRPDLRTNSVGLFVALFQKHPEYQRLFPGFADAPWTS